MPIADTGMPSLGLSLLKSSLTSQGLPSRIFYLNMLFRRYCGTELHGELVKGAPRTFDLAGEWLFSEALFGPNRHADERYIEQVLRGRSIHHQLLEDGSQEQFIDELLAARAGVEPFLADCLEHFDWGEFGIVGFSSVFQQQVASLALARRLKQRWPDLLIVFGGANVDGPAARTLVSKFPFVDVVFQGEADFTFARFVAGFNQGKPNWALPGIVTLHCGNSSEWKPLILAKGSRLESGSDLQQGADMDSLPESDFSDYFASRTSYGLATEPCNLAFESSRGCWWGARAHCTFCGLNASAMAFRAKSPQRVRAELSQLVQRYGDESRSVIATDNIIPFDYFESLLPDLSRDRLGVSIFYETKSNLRRKHVQRLKEAGIDVIQPGIESLSTRLLGLMRKGVTAIQNIQLLKLCAEMEMFVLWNILVGFPGGRPSDYDEIADLIPSLHHFQPPNLPAALRFDRFSPYTEHPEEFGIRNLSAYPSYRYVYRDVSHNDLQNLAYFFTGDFDEQELSCRALSLLRPIVKTWQLSHSRAILSLINSEDRWQIFDSRATEAQVKEVDPVEAEILQACNEIRLLGTLVAEVAQKCGVPSDDVWSRLNSMRHGPSRLVVIEGEKILGLAQI